jgi:O-antigen/teichoic acid export membrane protein
MLGFSIKLVITNIFNVINNNIFILVFGKFYTTTDVGTYSQADKWNKMGSGIITGMVQSVAQPMFVQVGNDEERQLRVFRKMLRFTAFIAFPTMFLLALVAPQLIVATVGQKWLPSAELMQLLCIGGAFLPIAALFSNLLISRGCSNIYMWNILAQGMLTLALLICVGQFKWTLDISIGGYVLQLGKMHLMVLCYVGVQMLWFFIWHTFLRREIHLSLLSALLDTMPFALLAALSMVCAALATQSFTNIYVLLLLRVVIAAAVYLSLLLLLRAKIVRECLQYIFRK